MSLAGLCSSLESQGTLLARQRQRWRRCDAGMGAAERTSERDALIEHLQLACQTCALAWATPRGRPWTGCAWQCRMQCTITCRGGSGSDCHHYCCCRWRRCHCCRHCRPSSPPPPGAPRWRCCHCRRCPSISARRSAACRLRAGLAAGQCAHAQARQRGSEGSGRGSEASAAVACQSAPQRSLQAQGGAGSGAGALGAVCARPGASAGQCGGTAVGVPRVRRRSSSVQEFAAARGATQRGGRWRPLCTCRCRRTREQRWRPLNHM
jgi:hypothetical protein